jgi:hypothetical protein
MLEYGWIPLAGESMLSLSLSPGEKVEEGRREVGN